MKTRIIYWLLIMTFGVTTLHAQQRQYASSALRVQQPTYVPLASYRPFNALQDGEIVSSAYVLPLASSKTWQRYTISPASTVGLRCTMAQKALGTYVSADELLSRTVMRSPTVGTPTVGNPTVPGGPGTPPTDGNKFGPLPDAVWLLLLLAATYALFLHKRRKTL